MTQLIVETQNDWTERKLKFMINLETEILKKAIVKSSEKLQNFENKYTDRYLNIHNERKLTLKGGFIMQASTDFQMSDLQTPQMYWDQVRDWLETTVTRERVEGAISLAANAAELPLVTLVSR